MPFGGQQEGQKNKKAKGVEQTQAPLVGAVAPLVQGPTMENLKDLVTPTTRSSNGSNSSDVSPSRQRASQYYDQFYKTKMCKFYLKQICMKGDTCKHAHSQEELRHSPDLRMTRLCNEYAETGMCTNNMCPYAHGQDQLRATGEFYKTQMCAYWQRNECKAGDQCRHAHGDGELRQLPPNFRASLARGAPGSPSHRGEAGDSPRSSRRGPRGSRGDSRRSSNADGRRGSTQSNRGGQMIFSPSAKQITPMGSPMQRTANGQSMAPMAPMAAMAANVPPSPMTPMAPMIIVDEHGTPQQPMAPGLVAFSSLSQMPMRLPMAVMSPPPVEINLGTMQQSDHGSVHGGSIHGGSPPNSPLARYGMPNVSADVLFAAMPQSYDD